MSVLKEKLVPDVLTEVYYNVNINDMLALCDTSIAIRKVCNNQNYWKEKGKRDFQVTTFEDPISHLQPKLRYIEIYSLTGVTFGTEIFIDPELALLRAIDERRFNLFEYHFGSYKSFLTNNNFTPGTTPTQREGSFIIRIGTNNVSLSIIAQVALTGDTEMLNIIDPRKVSDLVYWWLIRGRHFKLAEQWKKPRDIGRASSILASYAYGGNTKEFQDVLKLHNKPRLDPHYSKDIALAAAAGGNSDLFTKYYVSPETISSDSSFQSGLSALYDRSAGYGGNDLIVQIVLEKLGLQYLTDIIKGLIDRIWIRSTTAVAKAGSNNAMAQKLKLLKSLLLKVDGDKIVDDIFSYAIYSGEPFVLMILIEKFKNVDGERVKGILDLSQFNPIFNLEIVKLLVYRFADIRDWLVAELVTAYPDFLPIAEKYKL